MKIVNYNYICFICSKGFNWGDDSWKYGQADKPEESIVFCSTNCKQQHKTNKTKDKKTS